jgi:hypothetical protein
MGFVIDEVPLGQVYLQVYWVFPVSIIPPILHTHSHAAAIDVIQSSLPTAP